MNNYGKGSSGSLKSFDFDLGLGSGRPKSLNDQKNITTSSYSSYSSTTSAQSKPGWQPNKPSWTQQPAPNQATQPGLSGPSSMVGDIFGKSWGSSGGKISGIGIVNKNPNLFGDLVSSALGQGKSTGNWGTSSGYNNNSGIGSSNVNNNSKSQNLGGAPMKSMAGGAGGIGVKSGIGSKDPFGSLVDFSTKPSGSLNMVSNKGNKTQVAEEAFGDFQNALKPSTTAFPSSGFSSSNNDFMGSNVASGLNMDDFGMPAKNVGSQSQPSVQSSGSDPLDMFFSSSSASTRVASQASGGGGEQQFSGVDDWGLDSEFGGVGEGNDGSSTTELDGLPPPPAGVTASSAKSKGINNQKQGQYADAIKWLAWAVVLLEKNNDKAATMEVLSCRASCYKEVGEYKKAVADCSKVLEHDETNVQVLVQRALLYESMEKYKLGAEDLRTVLKIDPGNRIARSTVHRLAKMAD
ncbi:ethylene-responsive transcription factor RAP2-3-like [Hibiscus syriacus]|uniref:Ethylene-responsive transcription factor RAP2-3-like n=1 Tax=Hibiscus syriacus TaxID=106335 RepID=A0A6A3B4N8_HIBSY|nr:ethylene-responsive transcription factor RAP2-3-like [Hibiscus syriacus]